MSDTEGQPSGPAIPASGPAKEVSFEQAARLDHDRFPGELDQGRWVPVTRGTWRHGKVTGNVYAALRQYARQQGGWSVAVADPGTRLGGSPDILRGPDVAIVRQEREPKGKGVDGWLDGAPDVAVEVMGDAQSSTELVKKGLEYLAAGGKAVWLVDADAERVMVLLPPDRVRLLDKEETLDGGDALPGFSCAVADFFE